MTIIIGIKCRNGIVIACDSRTTRPEGYVNDNAQKLHVIAFSDGNSGILAESGDEKFASVVVEKVERISKERPMNDYRSFAECVEGAISEIRNRVREQNKGASSEELKRIFEEHDFEVMLAHYHGGKPYIFTASLSGGIASKENNAYCSIGCGWILANFLISRIDLSEFDSGSGMWTAVYAVEEIKKFDSRCGGRTRSAVVQWIDGKSVSALSAEAPMLKAVEEARSFSEDANLQWNEMTRERIRRLIADNVKSISG